MGFFVNLENMWKFKKVFEKDTIAYRGRLITSKNINSDLVEKIIRDAPSLAYKFEKVEEPTKEVQPVKTKIRVSKIK